MKYRFSQSWNQSNLPLYYSYIY